MNSIVTWIARIGEDSRFVTGMAHIWFAFSVMATCIHFGMGPWVSAIGCLLIAAGKEFGFDLRYEMHPRQTLFMSFEDFAEYAIGIGLAALVLR